jgi:hypothetical protein
MGGMEDSAAQIMSLMAECVDVWCPDSVRHANEQFLDNFIRSDFGSYSVLMHILASDNQNETCDYTTFAMLRRWFEIHSKSVA